MVVKGNAPTWAVELVKQVCADEKRKLPAELRWYNKNRESSSGNFSWYYERITIHAGTKDEDVKHVVLHELAHHCNAKGRKHRGEGHTVRFWKRAWKLYHLYGNPDYAKGREERYRAMSAVVYERHYK